MMTEALGRVQRFLESRALYWLVASGTAVALIWGLINMLEQNRLNRKQERLTACVVTYIEAQNANSRLRADTAADERKLLDGLIAAQNAALHIPDAGQRLAALQQAFATYEKGRAYAEGKRDASPIPPPPSQTCG